MTRYVAVMVAFTDPGAWTETIIPIEDEYPAVFIGRDDQNGDREFVLARRPGIAENIQSLTVDGSVPQPSDKALYIESRGVDATCVDCEVRIRFQASEDAGHALLPCIDGGHTTMLLYVHLDDANVTFLNRTVGDIREQCALLP